MMLLVEAMRSLIPLSISMAPLPLETPLYSEFLVTGTFLGAEFVIVNFHSVSHNWANIILCFIEAEIDTAG